MTVATVNGQPITAAEVDQKIGDELDSASQEYVNKVHDMRKQTVDAMVAEKLVSLEAKSRGMDEKALLKAEVEDKVPTPTDEQLQEDYNRLVKPKYPEITFEQAKPRLAQQRQQQAAQTRFFAFIDELKAKYHATESLPLPKVPRIDVAATGPSRGPADAKVTIIEFSDFQCPFCSRAVDTVRQVEKTYEGKVRVVFRNFPLPFHPNAQKAAEAGACAHDQGKFWEMHDQMFAHQDKLAPEDLKATARTIGLDGDKFDKCLDSGEKKALVEKDQEAGKAAHVNGTPAFFINGRPLSGAQPFDAFKDIIDGELAAK
jgi:protein-disulfide isomerase